MGTPALFDINIFEDVARARQGWESSLNAPALVEEGEVDGYVSAWTVAVIYYFRRRLGASEQEARERTKALTTEGGFRILALDAEVIKQTLTDDRFSGFEDAIQFHTAEQNGVNTIIGKPSGNPLGKNPSDVWEVLAQEWNQEEAHSWRTQPN